MRENEKFFLLFCWWRRRVKVESRKMGKKWKYFHHNHQFLLRSAKKTDNTTILTHKRISEDAGIAVHDFLFPMTDSNIFWMYKILRRMKGEKREWGMRDDLRIPLWTAVGWLWKTIQLTLFLFSYTIRSRKKGKQRHKFLPSHFIWFLSSIVQ